MVTDQIHGRHVVQANVSRQASWTRSGAATRTFQGSNIIRTLGRSQGRNGLARAGSFSYHPAPMLNPLWTRRLLVFLACCGVAVCHADPPSWGPQQGVLVLRNGRVVRGEITQVGDRFIVAIGDTDEVAVPVASVDLQCDSLEEAYRRRSERLSPAATAAIHLALADWCLTNGLLPQAAEQLMVAQQLEPENAEVARFERRLHLAARHGETPAAAHSAKTAAGPVKLEPQADLDQFTRGLPSGTLEHFTSGIQPLLVNRCGASGCHGPNAESEYRLARPMAGRLASRRLTQRNLYASMQFVDKEKPLSSQLILQATQAHGKSRQAPIDVRETESLRQLAHWLSRFQQTPTQPANPETPPTVLSQPDTAIDSDVRLVDHQEPLASSIEEEDEEGDEVLPPAREPPPGKSSRSTTDTPAPPTAAGVTDPFDPDIFNRRHHRRAD